MAAVEYDPRNFSLIIITSRSSFIISRYDNQGLIIMHLTSIHTVWMSSNFELWTWACCKTFGIASCVEKPPTPTQNMLSFSKHLGLCICLDFSFEFPQSTASITQKISVHCSRNSTLQNEAHCLYLYTFFMNFYGSDLSKFLFLFLFGIFELGRPHVLGYLFSHF